MYAFCMEIELQKGEQVVRASFSRYYFDEKSAGGMLYLTNKRLCFYPSFFDVTSVEQSGPLQNIPLADIVDVALPRKYGIFNRGLSIILRQHRGNMTFAVWHRRAWQQAIIMACSQP